MSKSHPLILLVEDIDHRSVISALMTKRVNGWKIRDSEYKVHIESLGSCTNVLDYEILKTYAQASDRKALGIIVDADTDASSRWRSIKTLAEKLDFKNIPDEMPEKGLIVANAEGLRFGAWVMPDNISPGMVESFCRSLLDTTTSLWSHAIKSCSDAREHGAEWKNTHKDRAELFTWLAWQDKPLGQMGGAIHGEQLNPHATATQPFLEWFTKLYELELNL